MWRCLVLVRGIGLLAGLSAFFGCGLYGGVMIVGLFCGGLERWFWGLIAFWDFLCLIGNLRVYEVMERPG